MSADPVTYRSANGIATITINRAEGMNRLHDAVVAGLHQAWRRLMNESGFGADREDLACSRVAITDSARRPLTGLQRPSLRRMQATRLI